MRKQRLPLALATLALLLLPALVAARGARMRRGGLRRAMRGRTLASLSAEQQRAAGERVLGAHAHLLHA